MAAGAEAPARTLREEGAVSDAPKVEVLTSPEVLVRLTYNSAGEPIVLAAGKQRERAYDLALIERWLHSMYHIVRSGDEP